MVVRGVDFPGRGRASLLNRILPRRTRSDVLWGFAMITPLCAGLLVFAYWPIIQTFYYTFTSWSEFGTVTWAGLSNYQALLTDPDIPRALINTTLFAFVSVPVSVGLSIIVAALLNQPVRGLVVYRVLYFLPVVTMPAAVGMIWKWIYNGDFGLLNQTLSLVGITGPQWLGDPRTALWAMTAVGVWGSIGYNMIILLAGLQTIPKMYYEAAEIDGASNLRRFLHVTVPLLSPSIFFTVVIGAINAFQLFDLVYLMIGPNSPTLPNTESLVYLFYQDAFINDDKGYAATITVLLLGVILFMTMIQLWAQRRWVYYE
ncbi:MAG: sugar ABC transporter permease [Mycobacterium sp.]|nr:sugar ABC transporter permease [Mycobacterium sp.]